MLAVGSGSSENTLQAVRRGGSCDSRIHCTFHRCVVAVRAHSGRVWDCSECALQNVSSICDCSVRWGGLIAGSIFCKQRGICNSSVSRGGWVSDCSVVL